MIIGSQVNEQLYSFISQDLLAFRATVLQIFEENGDAISGFLILAGSSVCGVMATTIRTHNDTPIARIWFFRFFRSDSVGVLVWD